MAGLVCALLAVGSSLGGIIFALAMRRHVRLWHQKRKEPKSYPRVTIFSPQRGQINERNIAALLEQDYPGAYEIIFATTRDDASCQQLQQYADKYENIRIVIADDVVELAQKHGIHRCQKNHNHVVALGAASPETEVYVFVDADGCPLRNWLKNLVAPFIDREKLGATTSARIFLPGNDQASMAQAVWTLVSGLFLIGPNHYIWGGGLAIPKVVFEDANLLGQLTGQGGAPIINDDLNIHEGLRRHGYHTLFVPDCLVPKYPSATREKWLDVIRYINRQMLHSWWVSKKLWLTGLLIYGITMPAMFCALAVAWWQPVGLLALSAIAINIACFFLTRSAFLVSTPKDIIMPVKFWRMFFFPLLVPCLASISFLAAPFSFRMRWGGVLYSKRNVIGYTRDSSWRSDHIK